MNTDSRSQAILQYVQNALFFLLRYETELTPCTGITAVTKQERRHFPRAVMIAPWCETLERKDPRDDPILQGRVKPLDGSFAVRDRVCDILVTTDEFAPILFVCMKGRFQGRQTPYDVPPKDSMEDALWFGLAVDELLKRVAQPHQFVWGADWQTVPAILLCHQRHYTSMTFHNFFDACLAESARQFGDTFAALGEMSEFHEGHVTANEVALKIADVVTTVNRGSAYGLRSERLQQRVMAPHIQAYAHRVVGVNNAAFKPLEEDLTQLLQTLVANPKIGRAALLEMKRTALETLPREITEKASGKVLVFSMGRRVSQKLHDVLAQALLEILSEEPDFPILAMFATIHGDSGSPARLQKMKELEIHFPNNIICLDGQVRFFSQLMRAADFNCMPSLFEPHGAAYEGTVVPIARAVDGLAEQIVGLNPRGETARMNRIWHPARESPSGILFREEIEPGSIPEDQLRALLIESPSPQNAVFQSMCQSLKLAIRDAIDLRLNRFEVYAQLVVGALERQKGTSWLTNLGGMLSLMEQARMKRRLRYGEGAA